MAEDMKRGKRHKVEYRGENWYVSVFNTEVFLSSAAETKDPKTAAGVEAIAVLLNLCFDKYEKAFVLEKLGSVSRSKTDMPGIICNLMKSEADNE